MTLMFMAVILLSGRVVQWLGGTLDGGSPLSAHLATMGLVGLAGMAAAVILGVWGSVQISIGREAARKNPSFTWWVINRLAFLVGANNLSTFAIYFLQGRLGYDGDAAAGPASQLKLVVGVLILIFALPSGWLADKIGRKLLVGISGLLATVGTVILLLSPNMTVIMVGGCIVGAGIGMFFTTNWALGTDIVPQKDAGKFLGISNLAGAGAGAVGAYIGLYADLRHLRGLVLDLFPGVDQGAGTADLWIRVCACVLPRRMTWSSSARTNLYPARSWPVRSMPGKCCLPSWMGNRLEPCAWNTCGPWCRISA
jgi:hypothetical protein